MTLKYSAARLQEKGVLLEVEGLPSAQLKNVTFEISPTSSSGVFTIKGKFMGVEMEKIDIDIQVIFSSHVRLLFLHLTESFFFP